jgi:hypothetical protein
VVSSRGRIARSVARFASTICMLMASPAQVSVAEIEVRSTRPVRYWTSRTVTHGEFAQASDVRFVPTVMFFDARGRSLAPPIAGLPQDFLGGYLDARRATSRRAPQ